MAEVIDTMTISSMGLSDHIKCVVCASMGRRHHQAVWQHHHDRINNAVEFDMLVTKVIVAVQFHSHSDTCKKGRYGQYKCQFCFGQVPAECTRPIELSLLPRDNDNFGKGGK